MQSPDHECRLKQSKLSSTRFFLTLSIAVIFLVHDKSRNDLLVCERLRPVVFDCQYPLFPKIWSITLESNGSDEAGLSNYGEGFQAFSNVESHRVFSSALSN